jgi:hypothetical protein
LRSAAEPERSGFSSFQTWWLQALSQPIRNDSARVLTQRKILGWETGIEPATVGATVRCSTS